MTFAPLSIFTMLALLLAKAKYLPEALTVLAKVTVWAGPLKSLMPATAEPFTVSVPLAKLIPLLTATALISPHAAPVVAAKVMLALIVTPPVPRLSSFACVPPLSKRLSVVEPFITHAEAPFQFTWFMAVMLLLLFVVCVLPEKVSVP